MVIKASPSKDNIFHNPSFGLEKNTFLKQYFNFLWETSFSLIQNLDCENVIHTRTSLYKHVLKTAGSTRIIEAYKEGFWWHFETSVLLLQGVAMFMLF